MGWREPLGSYCSDAMCDGDHQSGQTCFDTDESEEDD